jgi:hypothetical protein
MPPHPHGLASALKTECHLRARQTRIFNPLQRNALGMPLSILLEWNAIEDRDSCNTGSGDATRCLRT